ncbi:MAG: tetratricopeptide repeat protein, partial [Nevskia sp.]|nr:tetratricopeptide repeat protein [Nevskia sp.]
VEFDEAKWELRVHGQALDLEPRPLEVLNLMLRHAGEVVTKEEFFEAVWPGAIAGEKALTNAVAKLRKAVGDDDQTVIETVHKVGYRFIAAVTRKVVGRRTVTKLSLIPGDPVPRREQWRLVRSLGVSQRSEVWLAEHVKTQEKRVFKFSPDGAHLSSLKREATLSRVLTETLGHRADFVRVLEWNFEEPPYFLECEYGGQDWADWAESQSGLDHVPLAERLGLFLQAADAVAAAHSVGVLHKDLKPANLLIGSRKGGDWQVRLTDFGSGRLIDPAALADLGVTRMGFTQTQNLGSDSLTGTPMYLAPEVLAGQPPTQASDVYALGVILYQLVMGDLKRPISPDWEQEIRDELLREDISAAASGDPEKRLQTVHEFSDRVRQLESRRTKRANERALQYRAADLQRITDQARIRRPWIIAAGATLIMGMAASLGFFLQASRAKDRAIEQARIAQSTADFFRNDVFDAANPLHIGGKGEITVIQAIQSGIKKLDQKSVLEPAIEGEIRKTVGGIYESFGHEQDAEAQSKRAVSLLTQSFGPAADETLSAEYQLALTLVQESKFDEAKALLDKTDATLDSRKGGASIIRVDSDATRGVYLGMQEKYPEARPYFERALAAQLQIGPEDSNALFRIRMKLASAYMRTSEYSKARGIYEDILAATATSDGPDSLVHARVEYQFGINETLDGKYGQAEKLLEHAYATTSRILGADSSRSAEILSALANVYASTDRYDKAAEASRSAYASMRKSLGDKNQLTLMTLGNVGLLESLAGDNADAVRDLSGACEGLVAQFGSTHPAVQQFQFYLASSQLDLDHNAEAAALLPNLHAEALNTSSPSADWAARLILLKGQLLLQEGHAAEAQVALNDAFRQLQKVETTPPVLARAKALLERSSGSR